ncbi:MAG: cytochrome c oxidase subunit 3 [Candidatus Angelobacter sp.]
MSTTTPGEMTMPSHPPSSLMEKPAFSVPAKKMAMWLFIIADTATFAGCLVAYGFLRNATPNWPRPFHSITNLAAMTFILLTSSLTMLNGVRAARAGDKARALRWTLITAALGIAFALLHIREWMALIDEGMTLLKNPWGTGLFGASFYSITGLHLTHVTGGVIALIVIGLRYKGGRYNADDLEVLGLYWHFVDLVWMFVVPFVYLLNLAH